MRNPFRQVFLYLLLAGSFAAMSEAQESTSGWTHIGLLRVRDLTPFGILRLPDTPKNAESMLHQNFCNPPANSCRDTGYNDTLHNRFLS